MTIHVTNVPATLHDYPSGMHQEGGAGGAAVPPDFGRSEGAAGQRWRAALLPAPPDF